MLCHMTRRHHLHAQKRANRPAVHRQYEIIVLRRERLEQRGEYSSHDIRYGLIRVSGDHRKPEPMSTGSGSGIGSVTRVTVAADSL